MRHVQKLGNLLASFFSIHSKMLLVVDVSIFALHCFIYQCEYLSFCVLFSVSRNYADHNHMQAAFSVSRNYADHNHMQAAFFVSL